MRDAFSRSAAGSLGSRRGNSANSTPVAFTPAFFENSAKQIHWRAFLSKGLAAPESMLLADVMNAIRRFLMPARKVFATHRSSPSAQSAAAWRPRHSCTLHRAIYADAVAPCVLGAIERSIRAFNE